MEEEKIYSKFVKNLLIFTENNQDFLKISDLFAEMKGKNQDFSLKMKKK